MKKPKKEAKEKEMMMKKPKKEAKEKEMRMKKRKKEAKEMEMPMSVSDVYVDVMEDVINNVRSEFHSEGLDDNILNDLQSVGGSSSLGWT